MKKLRLILGDQLNSQHSWFNEVDENTLYLMAEMRQETDYVKHHIQKVVAFFLSMRNFATELQSKGHQVIYYKITDENNLHDLEKIITNCIEEHQISTFEYQLPDEFRLDEQLKNIASNLKIETKIYDTEHFYTSRTELTEFFEGKKLLLMENFYRMMRKKHEVLMQGSQPEGKQWNFDKDNRLKYKGQVPVPNAIIFSQNIENLITEIEKANVKTFGNINPKSFNFPTSRKECLAQLNFFCEHLLEYFGDYEDASHTDEKFLFHSRLSFAMNSKMLSPKEVNDKVVSYYYENSEKISINQVEGFVRQILGWREYVRGIYWKEMPNYGRMNALENYNKLPDFYWTGKTKMNCMQKAISQSLDEAYAHHIQRLMIIGNFSLLTQMHPDEVDAWYLGVYIDAIEWVELPNTRGMSQYADGGILATKPYVSSGSYINKMSNYCTSCHYKVKDKFGDDACPFNTLYWNFLDDKKEYFANNQRMGMMLNMLHKMKPEELVKIKEKANHVIENMQLY
uniref:cryptochrome/photolyase family protein n=1 Tax=Flavobacterium sp. TaxID=239 RepID=UPI0040491599